MSKGKYSPTITRQLANRPRSDFIYNADKKIAAIRQDVEEYDVRLHFTDYDSEGFDPYGYSAFDNNGNYVGPSNGVDRFGNTHDDYTFMSDDEYYGVYETGYW